MYIGYLKQCTIFADLNDDGQQSSNEPAGTTDEFGGWSLVVEESVANGAELVLQPGDACIDRYTDLPLTMPLTAPEGCKMVSILTDVKNRLISILINVQGLSKDDAIVKSDEAIAAAMGLVDPDVFDACTDDPIAAMWAGGLATASRRRLQLAAEVLTKVLALNMELITYVEQISGVAGFYSEQGQELAAVAVVQNEAEQMLAHEQAASPGQPVAFETSFMVTAAVNTTGAELGPNLEASLAETASARAEYVSKASAQVVADIGTDAKMALTDLAKIGVVAQAKDPDVQDSLDSAKQANTDDITSIEGLDAKLSTELASASLTESLDSAKSTAQVPEPVQAPTSSTGLPPPSTPPPPPPLPPPPLLKDQKDDVTAEDDAKYASFVVLLIPLLCCCYICIKYDGKVGAYLKYRTSHSNPHVLLFYMPKEARMELAELLFGKKTDLQQSLVSNKAGDAPMPIGNASQKDEAGSSAAEEKDATSVTRV